MHVAARTHYDTLQVTPDAGVEVIRASYQALMQKYQSDSYPNKAEGAQIALGLNDAYAVLSDPARRAAYDTLLRTASQYAVADTAPSQHERPAPPISARPPTQASSPPASSIRSRRPQLAPEQLGLRWATWCIYYLYPMNVLGCLGNGSNLLRLKDGNAIAGLLGVMFMVIGVIELLVVIQLRSRMMAAWKRNWIVVWGMYVLTVVTIAYNHAQQGTANMLLAGAITAGAGALVWLWPNIVYWKKREALFSEHPTDKLARQWFWLPMASYAAFAIAIIAAIAFEAFQGGSSRTDATDQLNEASSAMGQASDTSPIPLDKTNGWTEESTGEREMGPWLDYDLPGMRYYRDGSGMVIKIYPPGVKPNAPLTNPNNVTISHAYEGKQYRGSNGG